MRILNPLLPLLLTTLWLAGCTTPTITNLTPSRQVRKETGLYPFEVQWNSRQQSLIKESMKSAVVIGLDQYPMQRVALLTNRWETLVPIPADKTIVTYQFRFDYNYHGIPDRRSDSKPSRHYQLVILDQ